MSVKSVQFRSAADTIKAFENLDCEVWALWQDKQFIFKGAGSEELKSFLELMNSNGASNAIYTCAYYEGIEDKKLVNSKTPFDGSFNFRLNSDGQEITNGQYKQVFLQSDLQNKVGALEMKLDSIIQKMDGEDLEDPDLGMVGAILDHPVVAQILPRILEQVLNNFMPNGKKDFPQEPQRLSKVAGIGNILEQDVLLQSAIVRLLNKDKKLAQHLDKLADIAEQDPPTFTYILTTLDNIKTA
jgi:hypothetical protein